MKVLAVLDRPIEVIRVWAKGILPEEMKKKLHRLMGGATVEHRGKKYKLLFTDKGLLLIEF